MQRQEQENLVYHYLNLTILVHKF